MRTRHRWLVVVAGGWLLCPMAVAETIRLKDGTTVEGTVLERRDDSIVVRLANGGSVPYWLDEIAGIDASGAAGPSMDAAGRDGADPTQAAQPTLADADPDDSSEMPTAAGLVPFDGADRSIRLLYPAGWYAQESLTQQSYRIRITPHEPSAKEPDTVTIQLAKVPIETKEGEGEADPQAQLDAYITRRVDDIQGSLVSQQVTSLYGAPARLAEIEVMDVSGQRHQLVVAAVGNGMLVELICDAQAHAFEDWRGLCEAMAKGLEPFVQQGVGEETVAGLRQAMGLPASMPETPLDPSSQPVLPMSLAGSPVTLAVPAAWGVLPGTQPYQINVQTSAVIAQQLTGKIRTQPLPTVTIPMPPGRKQAPDQPPPPPRTRQWSLAEWIQSQIRDFETDGRRIVTPPTSLRAGSVEWTMLAWDSPISPGATLRYRGEHYYMEGGFGIVEVSLAGPSIVFDRFERKQLYGLLSSVRAPHAQAPVMSQPEASDEPAPADAEPASAKPVATESEPPAQ